MRDHQQLAASGLQALLNAIGGAHGDGCHNHQNGGFFGVGRQFKRHLFDITAGIGGEINHLRASREGLQLGGMAHAAAAQVAANHVLKIFFIEGNIAFRQRKHAGGIVVIGQHGSAEICQAGGYHRSQISRTINSDSHESLPGPASADKRCGLTLLLLVL